MDTNSANRGILIFLAIGLFCTEYSGAAIPVERIDRLFLAYDKPTSPGCALAVVKDGTIVYSRGYGMANLEYDVPNTPSTIFHIASISKHLTSFAVLLLEKEGKLSLDDDIRLYLPEMPDFGHKITIDQLMHHTSGLRDQFDLLELAGWNLEGDVITQQDILNLLFRQRDLNFIPGSAHMYSNTGYTLLAEVVSRISGQSFTDFTKERIFDPLGMNRTHFHDDNGLIVKNRAYSYHPAGRNYQNAPLNYATVGATSLFTTVEDFAKWDQNFYDGKVGGRDVIDKLLTRGRLNNGQILDYARGLVIGNYRGVTAINHSGWSSGFRSFYIQIPDRRLSVIIFANIFPNLDEVNKALSVLNLFWDEPSTNDPLLKSYNTVQGEAANPFVLTGKVESDVSPFLQKMQERAVIDRQIRTTPTVIFPQAINPTPEVYAQIKGRYYSEEVDVFFTVQRDPNNQLVLTDPRFSHYYFDNLSRDQFRLDGSINGKFLRSSSGQISGLTLSADRLVDFLFRKAEVHYAEDDVTTIQNWMIH